MRRDESGPGDPPASAYRPDWHRDPQPDLATGRLVLRPFLASDAPRVVELASDRELADTTQLPHPYPPNAAARWIAGHPTNWAAGTGINYAIIIEATGELVGTVSLIIHEPSESAELGYWIGRQFWNRGYATEAAGALIDYGFGVIGLHRISGPYMVRNPASGRVMEKLGMTPEGTARQAFRKWGRWEDIATRAVLRAEWEARASRRVDEDQPPDRSSRAVRHARRG